MTALIRPLAFAVAALLAFGSGSLVYKQVADDDGTYEVTAYFEKTIGLYPNSDVTVLGVPVGKITEVAPVGERVKVGMTIEESYPIPADAFAQIIPPSVISDRFVQLEPAYEGGPTLQDGAVLDTDRTQIPAELDDVFKQLKKLMEAIEPGEPGEPGALGELIVALDDALDDREQDLKQTLTNTSQLTQTLAQARGDLEGMLVNLDDLFGSLATRADTLGGLNQNFATVMAALAESRADLEGTIVNLASMTEEVGDLVQRNRTVLGRDLDKAVKITSAILRHRDSVEQSLTWLPVVGVGLAKAHHKAPVLATDVRDNMTSSRCDKLVDELPDELKEALKEIIDAVCGTAEREGEPRRQTGTTAPPLPQAPKLEVDCDRGVKKVKRQLERISELGSLSEQQKDELLKPLRKKLRKLSKRCEELEKALKDPQELLDDLLEGIERAPSTDDVQKKLEETTEELVGTAAGTAPVPDRSPAFTQRLTAWAGDFLRFLGWSR